MKKSTTNLTDAADRLIALLRQHNLKIVFAESCTAGLVAATLGQIPGISEWLCGSAVVYREATKLAWLDVSPDDLADPEITAVSPKVAESMALGVLKKTPEAQLSASITGYLGPDAAPEMDGVAFITVALRDSDGVPTIAGTKKADLSASPDRIGRQADAAAAVLIAVAEAIVSRLDQRSGE